MLNQNRTRFLLLSACISLLMSVPCCASSFNMSAMSSFAIPPSNDTLSFNASSGAVDPGGSFTQTGAWTINDSGSVNQYIPFTFNDTLTLNGITQILTFSAGLNVTPSQDTLSIAALGPVTFGNLSVVFGSFTASDANLETLPVTLNGTVSAVTGEPSSLLLLGTGIFGFSLLVIVRSRDLGAQRTIL